MVEEKQEGGIFCPPPRGKIGLRTYSLKFGDFQVWKYSRKQFVSVVQPEPFQNSCFNKLPPIWTLPLHSMFIYYLLFSIKNQAKLRRKIAGPYSRVLLYVWQNVLVEEKCEHTLPSRVAALCVSTLAYIAGVLGNEGAQVWEPPKFVLASYEWPTKLNHKDIVRTSGEALCFRGLIGTWTIFLTSLKTWIPLLF